MSSVEPPAGVADAIGLIPSGVFILTARRGEQETGILVSWLQQCSFEPPMVSVAIKKGRYVGEWLAAGEDFVVNVISEDRTDVVAHFGRGFKPDDEAFQGLAVERKQTGAPIIGNALAYLECKTVGKVESGDHIVFVGEVVAAEKRGSDKPMVHVRKDGMNY